jgi:hypothetical protein
LRLGPFTRDIGAQSIKPLDQPEVAVALQFQPGRKGEIPPAALARDYNSRWIDVQRRAVGVNPL